MISKTGIHATLALALMVRLAPDEYIGAGTIAEEIGAPRNYLGKLLQNLAGRGLVISQKGFAGGFRLARSAERISIYDVIEPIDHVSRWNGCFLGRHRCNDKSPCAVHTRWKHVREEYLQFLKETSLADVADRKVEVPE